MHACPRCGKQTEGAWSEGGLKWAICDECMAREREELEWERLELERERREAERRCDRGEWYDDDGGI